MSKGIFSGLVETLDLPGLEDPTPPKRKKVAYLTKGREQSSNIEDRRDEPMVTVKSSKSGIKLMKVKTSPKIMKYNDRGK